MSYMAVGVPGGGAVPEQKSWLQQMQEAIKTVVAPAPHQINASLPCPAGQTRAYVGAPCKGPTMVAAGTPAMGIQTAPSGKQKFLTRDEIKAAIERGRAKGGSDSEISRELINEHGVDSRQLEDVLGEMRMKKILVYGGIGAAGILTLVLVLRR